MRLRYVTKIIQIAGSTDGVVWNLAYKTQNNTAYETAVKTDNPITMQLLRFTLRQPISTYNGENVIGVKEIGAFQMYENVVLRQDITTEPEGARSGTVRDIIDGSELTEWISNSAESAYVVVDFGRPRQIKEVRSVDEIGWPKKIQWSLYTQ